MSLAVNSMVAWSTRDDSRNFPCNKTPQTLCILGLLFRIYKIFTFLIFFCERNMHGFSWSTVVLCPGLDSTVQERQRQTKEHQGVEGPGPSISSLRTG